MGNLYDEDMKVMFRKGMENGISALVIGDQCTV